MRVFLFLSAILLFSSLSLSSAFAEKIGTRDKAIVLIYTADWCSICDYMEPRWEDVKFVMSGEDVEFIEIDYSNKNTEMKSYSTLVKLGLGDKFFTNNSRQAGFGIVLDRNLKEQFRLDSSMTKRRMVYYIREAIKIGSQKKQGEQLNGL